MGQREPGWVHVPDNWTDKKRSGNPEIARIQEFLGKNVKEEVIRKHLLAEGIGEPGELEIVSIKTESNNKECAVEAMLHVVGMAWKVEDKSNPGLFVENDDAEIIKECDIGIKRVIKKDKEGTIRSAHSGSRQSPCDSQSLKDFAKGLVISKKLLYNG